MKRTPIKAYCIVGLLFQAVMAQLNTMADHYPQIEYIWNNDLGKMVNDTVYQDNYQLGDINLRKSNVTIQPNGSYLDITERAEVSIIPTIDNLNYYISGRLNLPAKSVIVSLYVSKDTSGYSARILPAYKLDFPIDSTLGDALATIKKSGTNYGAGGTGIDYYDFRLNNTIPGKSYLIIIRYLVPNRGNPTSPYNLNLLVANSSTKNCPRSIELDFNAGKKEKTYKLSIGSFNYQLSSGMSLQVPFQNSFSINISDQISSMAHTTDFTTGTWKGKYLLLNTSIPDSVMSSLSKKMETIVLWRWNKPSSFATKTDYGKYLTSYGYQAVSQAQAIRTLDSMIVNTGNQAALVHSIQFQSSPQVFGMGGKGSSNYAKLDGYLRQINEDYIINSGYFESDVGPVNPGDTLKDSTVFEFRKAMKIVNGLYSNGKDSILRHLIIVSAGPASISQDQISVDMLDSLFNKSFSVDCDQAVWNHISFPIIKNISLQRSFTSFAGFNVPEFRPNSIILQMANSSKNYSFPLSPDQASFSIIAKSDSTWNDELTWNGYDRNGKLFSTAKSKMESYVSDKDTGLVKLWAGNSERLSEKSESGLELKYGVVSEDYCLKIYPSFKGYDSTSTAYSTTEYYYAPDKKSTQINIRFGTADRLVLSLIAGKLYIKLPGNGIVKRIRIYSLDGKLLADFDPSQFRTPEGYMINQFSLHLKELFRGVVLIRLDSSIGTFKQKMVIR